MRVSDKKIKSIRSTGGESHARRRVFLFALGFFLITGVAHAQFTSRLGRFQVDQVKGCAPFTITITTTNLITVGECTGGKPCLMTFEPGQSCPANPTCKNQFTYTYSTPGTFTLSVLYQSIGADDITVTVVPNIQPKFELYTCSGNAVSLKVTDKNYEQYFIDFGDGSPEVGIPFSNNQVASHTYTPPPGTFTVAVRGKNLNAADNCTALTEPFDALSVLPAPTINTLAAIDANRARLDFTAAPHLQLHLEIAINNSSSFQLYKSLYGVSIDTATNGLLNNNYYCFRMSAFDPCTGGNSYSNSICTQIFNVSAANALNKLTWNTSATGITDFDIARNQAPYATTATQFYDDAGVVCKTTYCYQIRANYANGSTSTSLEKCVEAFKLVVPPAITDASAVVSSSQVSLTWIQDALFTTVQYSIYRSSGTGPFSLLGSSATPDFADPGYSTASNFCYRVDYADECGNLSPNGSTICPIRLEGKPDNNNAVPLSWSGYDGWKNGVKNYTLQKYDKDGILLATFDVGTQTVYLDDEVDLVNQIVSYLVIATPNDPLANSVSNVVRVIKGVNLFSPTAFTPNGDGVNDGLIIQGQYISSMAVSIFDRWGTLIYSAGKDVPWDGTYSGKLMPETTYVWKAEGTDIAGQHFTQTGTVVLLKKGK